MDLDDRYLCCHCGDRMVKKRNTYCSSDCYIECMGECAPEAHGHLEITGDER